MKNVIHVTMMNMVKTWALMALLVSVATTFGADKAYLVSGDAAGTSSWTNAHNWAIGSTSGSRLGEVGEALPVNYDYIVSGGKATRTDAAGKTFPGASLSIGEGSSDGMMILISNSAGERYTCSGSVTLACGTISCWWGYMATLNADFTVTAPATAPFKFYTNSTTADDLILDGSFVGSSSAAIWVYARLRKSDTSTTPSVRLVFTGDMLKDYAGLITCHPYIYAYRNDEILEGVAAKVASGTVNSPAKVVLNQNCTIGGVAATDVVAIDSLTAKAGSAIELAYDKTALKVSCVVVTNSLVIEDKLLIAFDPKVGSAYTSQPVLPKSPILKAPAGVTLDPDDFELDCTALFPVYELLVDEVDGISTLFIQQHGEVITQVTADSNNDYSSGNDSFRSGAHWSKTDTPPTDDNIYYSTKGMRAYPHADSTSFSGHALALNGGVLYLFCKETRIDDLRILGESYLYNYRWASDNTARLTGHILQHTASTVGFKCVADGSRKLDVGSDIEGYGLLRFVVGDATTSMVRVSGDNSDFSGKYFVGSTAGKSTESNHLEFYFNSAAAMGGAMSSWTYDGHRFGEYVNINVENSMELDRANCGWFVNGYSSLTCTNNITFTLKERITWKGELTKKGVGTLALGGPAPYFNSDKGTTPTTDKNVLNIAAGTLKPLSSEAFNGIALNFAIGTSLALEVPENAETSFGARGMSVTGTGAALTLPAEGLTVTITDPNSYLTSANNRIPICTVASGDAASVRGKFTVSSYPESGDRQLQIKETQNADDTVTFSAVLARGLTLFVK